MAARPHLFIGSSSEGLRLAKVLKELLAPAVEVDLWPSAFKVGETYIGVLEQESREADFAVLLLTDDDEVIQLTQLVAARQFSESIKGFWWCDREWDKENSVAFVELSVDRPNWMPKVRGQAWDRRGESVASWSSVATCVQPGDGVLYFNFTGHHPLSRNARDRTSGEYVGFTTYTFHPPLGSPVTGEGEISDLNLDQKKVRKLLHLRLRRCTSSKEIEVMTEEKPNPRKVARVVEQQLPARSHRRSKARA
jgi:hypothetical protein